ncbi:glycosyltransferase family 4 protein [Clostridium intestinale]|uniref:Glycosyltransferase family 4 protein n=1 Tax=Clostridium intestinale TaxID=36845 RepID=A0A7D6VPI6_9CLOT|nr:glycosyltransferase family 4 protein [Clostridium intestinale]QLY79106.1 glycosyltransferase family 4 protein [Clostridium intestinale]
MKILHLCLANYYIDDYNYQENALVIANKMDNHEVKIIASTETFVENSKVGYLNPKKYITKEGVEINRIAYKKYLPHSIMKKIRNYDNVYNLIDEFSPDVIYFHGISAYELITVAKYKKNNPNVKFYVDNHADANNSGNNFISRFILHKIIYKNIIKVAYKYIDKIFYITYETKEFLKNVYGLKEDKMEFFPLGGYVLSKEEISLKRKMIRKQHSLKNDDILLVHSGKLDKFKRTKELIEAFHNTNKKNLKLFIIGSIDESQKKDILEMIKKDIRVSYLGWKSADELQEYLCACDLYVQPGGQSATMQNALCSGAAVALYPHKSHKFLLGDKAFYIEDIKDMIDLFNDISDNVEILSNKKDILYALAYEKLDYRKLAQRIYE